jgi:hypothetical protein
MANVRRWEDEKGTGLFSVKASHRDVMPRELRRPLSSASATCLMRCLRTEEREQE